MPEIFSQSELATVQQDLTPKEKAIEMPNNSNPDVLPAARPQPRPQRLPRCTCPLG